jgi:pSer/pThr/pTyr-binding forkhead associated (FHA) protein
MTRAMPGLLTYRPSKGSQELIHLRQDVMTLGRSDACAVVIAQHAVSRLHARVELQYDRYVLFDAGSANGTYVNGKRIDNAHPLNTGDIIWLGSSDVILEFTDPEQTSLTQPSVGAPPLEIDDDARTVKVYRVPVQLSPLEYSLLIQLAYNKGSVCTREACYLAVWGHSYDQAKCEDALNACIAKLRRNLRAAAQSVNQAPPEIATLQRVGFRLDTDVAIVSRAKEPRPA